MAKQGTPVLRQTPEGLMQEIQEKLPLGWYAAGGFCMLYACIFPLYRLAHFLIFGLLAAAVGVLVQRLVPAHTRLVPYTRPVALTGDEVVDELLQQGEQALQAIRAANRALPDATISAHLDRIEAACTRIFDYVKQNPAQASQCRKFMNYYLPTLLKLLEVRTQLEGAGAAGENIRNSQQRIAAVLAKAAAAFENFNDQLHADEAMNVNAEISVFEGMLQQEGLLRAEGPSLQNPAGQTLGGH